ncbi:hypothetical protein TIFTF001_042081 [Ficus carica]|uniref:Uncharacterized protein n=1 Tax=Ficus carica TaxID=3494 RepID=A0AA87ZCT8_FICCA|nr:hypothetical protein TIFTF001_042081 [Ficus carica]
MVVVLEIAFGIAIGAEIEGVAGVEALDTSEVEAVELAAALGAKDASGLEDVVQGQEFPEVKIAVAVGVEVVEPVAVDPVVAIPVKEQRKLRHANSAVLIPVH